MAIATDAMRQAVANAYTGLAPYASLHTAAPGTTGASEVTGGSPAYARKALTWTPGTTGTATSTATFDVPTGITVAQAGVWSAVTAGTFRDNADITDQAFASQGTLTVNFTYTQT